MAMSFDLRSSRLAILYYNRLCTAREFRTILRNSLAFCGSIVVVENRFAFKQVIPLDLGENEFGRYVRGTNINKPIETRDPSIDTFHCVITVKKNKQGKLQYILRDAPSDTGTFYMNDILRDVDRINLEDGAIITIGATTLILRAANS